MPETVSLLSSNAARVSRGNTPKYVIFHTNGGGNSATPASIKSFIESELAGGNTSVTQPHYDLGWSANWRLLDWNARAVCSYQADGISISVETQDSGYLNIPLANDPWNNYQIEEAAQICAQAHRRYGIPLRVPTHPLNDTGIGWHSMWGVNRYSDVPGTYGTIIVDGRKIQLNNPWTKVVGKTCPGQARINQMSTIINRAITIVQTPSARDDDMIRLLQLPQGIYVSGDMVTYRAVSPGDITWMAQNGIVEVVGANAKTYTGSGDMLNRMYDVSPEAVLGRINYLVQQIISRIPPGSAGITQADITAIVNGVLAGLPKKGTFTLG